jgi:uncharacterized membrane protein
MAEEEARHRREAEMRLMRLSEAGLLSAFLLAPAIAGGGLVAAVLGAELTGVATVTATLSALVGVFVFARRAPRLEGADARRPATAVRGGP